MSAAPSQDLADLDATRALARRIARLVRARDVILLDGPLGAGKTTFVRFLVEALDGDPDRVASPTFTLLHQYAARIPVIHIDAYRLGGARDLAGLGFDELAEPALAVIEWGERVASAIDPARLWRIALAHAPAAGAEAGADAEGGSLPGARIATVVPHSREAEAWRISGVVSTLTAASALAGESPEPPVAAPSPRAIPDPGPRTPDPGPPTGDVIRIPASGAGGDPLVARYLAEFHGTCAYRTISWWSFIVGIACAVAGGAVGSLLAGPVDPLHETVDALVRFVHGHFGNLQGCLWGMVAGALVASVLGVVTAGGRLALFAGVVALAVVHNGAWWWALDGHGPRGWTSALAWGAGALAVIGLALHRGRVAAGQEPWFAQLLVMVVYLYHYDWLICLGVVASAVCLVYILAILFRLLALLLGGDHGLRSEAPEPPPGGWPLYTVLVPLYHERNVARNILVSLRRLDYPRDRLDVKFLLEADDPDTLRALTEAGIPPWAEIVVVPEAQPKTKPRACNHGLERARGEFLVVFDAEDRPDGDQLKQAVAVFRDQVASVACLQAQLAYHNHRQNLLTRWFALEYNVWFRRYLAGLVRLRVPIPLGGTSNHFRTDVLRRIGGWDPFNVTEDCDLGVRLAMAGHRTCTLDSTTWEEANSRVGNWLRQRSRWLKGYLITHLVWGRRPLRLLWTLNPWGALGFALSVFCVSSLAALNLLLWGITAWYVSRLAIDMGHGHALWDLLATRDIDHERASWPMLFLGRNEDPTLSLLSLVFFIASCCLLVGNLAFILINAAAGRRPGQRGLWFAALLSPIYWVLISLAAWKAIWQLLVKPHYWEKTVHGLDERAPVPPPAGGP